jgi:hypothetical protein
MSTDILPAHFRELRGALLLELPGGSGAAALELRVEEVRLLPAHRLRPEPFSLQLRGPQAPLLPQATYGVVHPELGRIELFLVPLRSDAAGSVYEAVFN